MRVAILAVLVMTACATPYQRRAFNGGYADQRLSDDQFLISVNVNSYTSSSTAYAYFVRRAAEVCYEAGYRRWAIEDRSSSTDVYAYNGQAYAKPHVEGVVRCTK